MIVSEQLHKDPNELTDEDFAKITDIPIQNSSLRISGGIRLTKLSDIMLLRKFTNLQALDFGIIMYPQNKIPKWMTILSKLGNFDPYAGRLRILNRLQISPAFIHLRFQA